VEGLRRGLSIDVDAEQVLLGAALHDAGKMEHPSEMHGPGHAHERSGETLLRREGFPEHIARVCVTHAAWAKPPAELEDRIVALSDKLWKGKRDADLEAHVLEELAVKVGQPAWEVFDLFDTLCEQVAAEGPSRLGRSNVGA
jgi:HD superfamily phosphodiesterase